MYNKDEINFIASLIDDEPTFSSDVILEQLRRWREAAEVLRRKFGYEQSEEELIEVAQSMDPTANEKEPKYVDWIFRLFKPVRGHPQITITDQEDLDNVRELLLKYEQYKPLAQRAKKSVEHGEVGRASLKVGDADVAVVDMEAVASLSPNINSYRTLEALDAALNEVDIGLGRATKPEKEIILDMELLPGSRWVSETENYALMEVSEPAALNYYGRGTSWCTGGSIETAKGYIERTGSQYIVWRKPTKDDPSWTPLYQFQRDFGQFQAARYGANLPSKDDPEIQKLVTPTEADIKKAPERIVGYAQMLRKRLVDLEPHIAKSPRCAADYAVSIIKERWPEAEESIFSSPYAAALYANKILYKALGEEKTLNLLGEKLVNRIMQNPKAARTISHGFGRWEEAEPYILKDPNQAIEYYKEHAQQFPGASWPELIDKVIESNNPQAAANFAINIARDRVKSLEPTILKDPNAAIDYMNRLGKQFRDPLYGGHGSWRSAVKPGDVLWPELKEIIWESGRADWMYKYALSEMKRWPEAEATIVQNPGVAQQYYQQFKSEFADHRWKALENKLLEGGSPSAIVDYALHLRGRWPEAEPHIIKSLDATSKYAEMVGRFPLADEIYISDPEKALTYMDAAGSKKGRYRQPWPELEELIKDDADNAIRYAKLTGQRFKGGEEAILQDDLGKAMQYMKDWETGFKNDEWPAFRDKALELLEKLPNMIVVYSSITGIPIPHDALERLKSLRSGLWYQIAQNIASRRTQ